MNIIIKFPVLVTSITTFIACFWGQMLNPSFPQDPAQRRFSLVLWYVKCNTLL